MKIETDLKYIEKMGEVRDEENWAFRTFLKQIDLGTDELDVIVHQITTEVTSQIDCTTCGNCCKQIRPVLDEDDSSEFALGLKMAAPEFEGKYLKPHEDEVSKYVFKEMPCPFLKDKRCMNYEYRPQDCRSYPHLHKDRFVSRLWGVLANYSICPIVFNVYERLKRELWHNDGV
ncbi:MAG: YkgJ family cysteine cluster protein [Anaerolineales bacterium]|nr:YkgJ family cysteine cluster protein [Anaerolineales bacterium]